MQKSIKYKEYLLKTLQNNTEAANYLNAALNGGDFKVFLLALQNVAQAQGGLANLATKTGKSRTSLYKTLSHNGNPYLKNVMEILEASDLRFTVVANAGVNKKRAAK